MTVCAETTKANKILARGNWSGEGMWSVDRQGGSLNFRAAGLDAMCACERDPHVLSVHFTLFLRPFLSLFSALSLFFASVHLYILSLVPFPLAASVSLAHARRIKTAAADHHSGSPLYTSFFFPFFIFLSLFFILSSLFYRSLSFTRFLGVDPIRSNRENRARS